MLGCSPHGGGMTRAMSASGPKLFRAMSSTEVFTSGPMDRVIQVELYFRPSGRRNTAAVSELAVPPAYAA